MVAVLAVLLLAVAGLGIWVVGMLGQDTTPIELRLRLEPGRSYALKTATESEVAMKAAGQNMAQKGSNAVALTLDVQEIDAHGHAVTRVTVDSLSMDAADGATQGVSIPGVDVEAMQSSAAAAVAGKQFTATISPSGKTVSVSGLDEVRAAVQRDAGLMGAILAQVLTDEMMTRALDDAFAVYAPGQVRVGSTWTRSIPGPSGTPVNVDYSFRLRDRSDGVATVEVDGDVSTADPGNLGGLGVKADFSGRLGGRIRVDEATGCILESTIEHEITGKMQAQGESGTISISGVTTSSFTDKGYTPSATSEDAGG